MKSLAQTPEKGIRHDFQVVQGDDSDASIGLKIDNSHEKRMLENPIELQSDLKRPCHYIPVNCCD